MRTRLFHYVHRHGIVRIRNTVYHGGSVGEVTMHIQAHAFIPARVVGYFADTEFRNTYPALMSTHARAATGHGRPTLAGTRNWTIRYTKED